MGDGSGWSAVIAGLASIYGAKKKKDAQQDAYKYQQDELNRQKAYAQQLYEQKRNSPQAKMSRYMLEYYLPQYVSKMKSRGGGDGSVLDRMLEDILGGMKNNGQSSASGGYGGSDPFLVRPGVRKA
jgi:hypothetical protein